MLAAAYPPIVCWATFEVGLRVRDAVRDKGRRGQDRGSRALIAFALAGSVWGAFGARALVSGLDAATGYPGVVVLWLGLALRVWAVVAHGAADSRHLVKTPRFWDGPRAAAGQGLPVMWQHVAGGEGEREFLPLCELEGAQVSVAAAPIESALVTTIATLRARRPVAALRRRDVEALRPLVDYRTRAWPSCLTRAAGEGDFAADVAAGVGQGRLHAGVWAPVLDAPERWLRSYGAAIERVWSEVGPRWRCASSLLQREAERVEAAAERGGAVALATTAGSVRDGTWRLFERRDPAGLRLRRGRLVLRPLLAPVSLVEAGDELVSVSYPLVARDDGSPPASLDALLAPARATILRALDHPVNAGQLADRHGFSPSGMTHHLGAMEKAGLIARERAGRRVVVRRTHRGTRLLALYE